MPALNELTLAQICSGEPVSVPLSASVHDAVARMRGRNISSVVVVDAGRPVGIFTEADLIALLSVGEMNADRPITELMSPDPICAPDDLPVLEAYARMSDQRIRHLIVVDDKGRLTGLVSESDFLRVLTDDDLLRPATVAELMIHDPVTLPPEAPLSEALARMRGRQISSVLITVGTRAVGILTERDLVRLEDDQRISGHTPLGDCMSQPVVGIGRDASGGAAIERMHLNQIRHLAVVDGDELVGLISRRDLVKGLGARYGSFLTRLGVRTANDSPLPRDGLSDAAILHTLLNREHFLGLMLTGPDARVRFANRTARRLTGLASEDIGTLTLARLVLRLGGDEAAFERRRAALRHQRTFHCELHGVDEDTVLLAEISAMPDADDGIGGYLLMILDISERRSSQALFAHLLEATPSAIAIIGATTGTVLEANERLLEFTGRTRAQLVDRAADVDGWVEPGPWGAYLEQLRRDGRVRSFELPLRHASGDARVALVSGSLVRYRGEDCALSVLTDITARSLGEKALEQQNALLNSIFEAIPDALLITDDQRRVVMANKAVETVFGYTRDEIIGRRSTLFYADPTNFERTGHSHYNRDSRDTHAPYEMDYRRKNGEVFPSETIGGVIRAPNDGVVGYLGLIRDVSVARRERDAAALHQRRLADLIDNMADWVWELDADGRFSFVSERIRDVLGYDPAWVIGKTPFDLMYKEEGEAWQRRFDERWHDGEGIGDLEIEHRHKDGGRRILAVSGTPVRDASGALTGYRGVSRDITDAREAHEALRQSEAQLQAIFDNASIGIMLLTGYRVMARGNQRLADILGYDSPEEMLGISMRQLHLSQERFVEFGEAHYDTLRQQEQMHVEYELRRKDGRAVWCLLSGRALDTTRPADLSRGVIWIVDDISVQKAEEGQLILANKHLDEERQLFTAGPTMVFRWRPELSWPVSYCSPNVERQLGIRPEAFTSGEIAFADCIHPDDLIRVGEEVSAFVREGRDDFEQEYRLRGADGDWRHVYDYTRILRDEFGNVLAYHGYLVDITERRRHQAELRALLDAIPDLIFFKDETGHYVECNDAFTRFVGRERDGVIGHTDHDLFPAEQAAFFRRKDQEMLASGEARRNEEWVTYPDGNRVLLDTLKTPYTRSDREHLGVLGVLGINRDATEQHRQSQELQQAEELAEIGSGYQDLLSGEIHWSPMLYKILGLDPATTEASLEALAARVIPEEREAVRDALRSVTTGDSHFVEIEYTIVRGDGSPRRLFSRREMIFDDNDRPVRIDGIVQDITDRSEAMEHLREAQQIARLGSWNLNLRNQTLDWSEEVFRIFERDPSRFDPTLDNFYTCVHPDDRAKVRDAFDRAVREHTPYQIVHRVLSTTRRVKYVEEQGRILYDRNGDAVRAAGTVVDITDRHVAEKALRESEARYRSIFESAGQGMLILDRSGKITSANQTACDILGYPGPGAILSARPQTLSPPTQPDGKDSSGKGSRLIESAFERGSVRFEWDHQHLDGHIVPIEVTLTRIDIGGQNAVLCTWFDLSDKRRAKELESRASAVFENTSEGIMITDAQTRILSVNPAFTEITGYSEEDVRWRRPSFLQSGRQGKEFYQALWRELQATGRWQGEIWNRRKNDEIYPEWLSISTIHDENGDVQNYIGVFSDVSESHRFEEKIDRLSHFDPLTNLPNPVLLRARLTQAIDSARVAGTQIAAILLRIDGYDRMITSFGHEATDEVIALIAERLAGVAPADATLSRFGNDVFALAAESPVGSNHVTRLAHDMQDRLRGGIAATPIGHISVVSNVGIAVFPSDTEDGAALLRFAESALHTAREAGPGALAYYHPEMTEAATHRIQLEQALRDALAHDEFELFFQPKISLGRGNIVGVEALIRWRRDDGTLVPPNDFMPIVESSDLVHPVGRWVLRRAARTVLDWQAQGLRPIRVSVNISGAMISGGILAEEIDAALKDTGLDAHLLEIEVLENVLLDDPDLATRQMNEVHALGVSIALDDFGTGYSSLAYLQSLPFDTIKLDRTFVTDLEHSTASQAVVRATLSMARNLSRTVVAEGVETEIQAQQLMRLGCDAVQGFLTGRPMPADDLRHLLEPGSEAEITHMINALTEPKALLVEDDAEQRLLLENQLLAAHWKVVSVASAEDARVVMSVEPIDLLLVDYGLPGVDGIELLESFRASHPETVRVMISVTDTPLVIQEAINRAGVFRYLVKPIADDILHDVLRDVRNLAQRLWQYGSESPRRNGD